MRAITVTCASALAFALQLWLKFCMQGCFSQTTYAIALKLHTLIGHHQMTLQDKSQYSILDFDSIVHLEILVKVLRATKLRVHISVFTLCIALQLYTMLPNHHTFVYYQVR